MVIELNGMHFHAHHGCYAEEKITGNAFEVSLRLRPVDNPAPHTDNIADALNYQEVYLLVAKEMEKTSNLLENVAQRILDALFNHFTILAWAEVTVAKLAPAMGGRIDRVQVSLFHERIDSHTLDGTTPEAQSLLQLIAHMRRIRKECPWDAKQTIPSLIQYTTEEVYELFDAILDDNNTEICKELGDLLMHVLFYAVIAEEEGRFTLRQIAEAVSEKIVYRHPHVFQKNGDLTPEQVEQQWEALKLKEKGGNRTVLAGVPRSLPPLVKAVRIQEKTGAVGFQWKQEDVWAKIDEEYVELREALLEGNPDHVIEEFGDLLFTLVDATRTHGIDPSIALEGANRKFMARFNYVEAAATTKGRSLQTLTPKEMDELWQEAKKVVCEKDTVKK